MVAVIQPPVEPLLARLCESHRIQRLAVFGSALRDDFTPDSDVDLLVEFQPGATPGLGFFAIQEELTDLRQKLESTLQQQADDKETSP